MNKESFGITKESRLELIEYINDFLDRDNVVGFVFCGITIPAENKMGVSGVSGLSVAFSKADAKRIIKHALHRYVEKIEKEEGDGTINDISFSREGNA